MDGACRAAKKMEGAMKGLAIGAALLGVLTLNGCAGMDPKEQRVLSGAAVGTGAGALTTVITGGCIPCGAAIGAAVGAGAGYVVHEIEKDK
jgi:hypothetical protein